MGARSFERQNAALAGRKSKSLEDRSGLAMALNDACYINLTDPGDYVDEDSLSV